MTFSINIRLKQLCLFIMVSLPFSSALEAADWQDTLRMGLHEFNSLPQKDRAIIIVATVAVMYTVLFCAYSYFKALQRPKVITPIDFEARSISSSVHSDQVAKNTYQIYKFSKRRRSFERDITDLNAMLSPRFNDFERERLFESGGISTDCCYPKELGMRQSIIYLAENRKLSLRMPNSLLLRSDDRTYNFETVYTKADTYIMRRNGTFIGFVITGIRKQLNEEGKVRSCMLFIHPHFRREGHAKRLFNHMVQDLMKRGYRQISFCIEKSDPACAQWYDRLEGFTRTELSQWEYLYKRN